MHDAIQSLNDELQQERHSWQTSASGGPHATLPADLTATPDLTLDTQKLVRADQQQDDQQQHAEQSEAGSDDSGASRYHCY